jgi:hypothetical protein
MAAKKVTIKPSKKGQKKITFTPGGLHKSTKTPAGKKIPAAKMRKALAGKLGPKAKKQALFKKNVLTGKKKGR